MSGRPVRPSFGRKDHQAPCADAFQTAVPRRRVTTSTTGWPFFVTGTDGQRSCGRNKSAGFSQLQPF